MQIFYRIEIAELLNPSLKAADLLQIRPPSAGNLSTCTAVTQREGTG